MRVIGAADTGVEPPRRNVNISSVELMRSWSKYHPGMPSRSFPTQAGRGRNGETSSGRSLTRIASGGVRPYRGHVRSEVDEEHMYMLLKLGHSDEAFVAA